MKKDYTALTLDAGGTNFVFSAIRDFKQISKSFTLPSNAHDLEACLSNMINGFRQLKEEVGPVDAISFAFPGPADYRQGIIGRLPNFKAFQEKPVPLADILRNEFNVPVFINNDANLFASGEAIAGLLPMLNERLRKAGSHKQFGNLIGITLGTGFGCGIVIDDQLLTGDNSSGAEIHNTLNKLHPNWNAEEDVSIRSIQRIYKELSNETKDLSPEEIYLIGKGKIKGNTNAARETFNHFGKAIGSSLVNVLSLIDGIVVIGGGLSGAWDMFADAMFEELNGSHETSEGKQNPRLSFEVFNLEDENSFEQFAKGSLIDVAVPGTSIVRKYDAMPRTGVGLSTLGISQATALGAYAFAIPQLNKS